MSGRHGEFRRRVGGVPVVFMEMAELIGGEIVFVDRGRFQNRADKEMFG